jgi:lysophospholipase L1-like esterase
MTENEIFPQVELRLMRRFYNTHVPNLARIERFSLEFEHEVDNLFFGDSITEQWALDDFFPNHSILNRGIGGDQPAGLYMRLERDVFRFRPKRVFLLIGINVINRQQELIIAQICAIAEKIKASGSEVVLASILPLRNGDEFNRFQYMDKICAINGELGKWAKANGLIYLDYFSLMIGDDGQMIEEYAQADGLHVSIKGYVKMSQLIKNYLVNRTY